MRKVNLDILRILACFLVIVNHTNSDVFLSTVPSLTWFSSVLYFFVSKVAVPLFVMISGAVLLSKKETYKEFFKKRILKTMLVLISFSFMYYMISIIKTGGTFDVIDFIRKLYSQQITNAFWYLYLYLGILLMLPLLRKLVEKLSVKDYIYYFSISITVFSILPIVEHYLEFPPIQNHFMLPIFNIYITYFLLGHFIENVLDKKYFNNKISATLLIGGTFAIIMSVILTYNEYKINPSNYLFFDKAILITTLIPSVMLFYISKLYFCDKTGKGYNVISKISTHTFGIYLISDLLISELQPLKTNLMAITHSLIGVIIFEIVVFTAGLILTWILKKLPILRKVL